jgi:hypothetical protein
VSPRGTDRSPKAALHNRRSHGFLLRASTSGVLAGVRGTSAAEEVQLFGPAGPSQSSWYIGVPTVPKRSHQRSASAISFPDAPQWSNASLCPGRSRPVEQRGPTQCRPI